MRFSELIKITNKQIDEKLKEIKDSDEEDAGKLASMYDNLSEAADRAATKFSEVDKLMSGDDQDNQDEEQSSSSSRSRSKEKADA